jgi:hypothetical protein
MSKPADNRPRSTAGETAESLGKASAGRELSRDLSRLTPTKWRPAQLRQVEQPATSPEPAKSRRDRTGAQRQARARSRARQGRRIFRLLLDEDAAAEAVIAAGLVTDEQARDHGAVEAALAALIRSRILP